MFTYFRNWCSSLAKYAPCLKDLNTLGVSFDIFLKHIFDSDEDEISEMYTDSEKIINENKEKPEKIAEAYLKQSLYLFLNKEAENGKEAIKKATKLYSSIGEADASRLKSELVTDLNAHGIAAIERFDEEIAEWTEAMGKKPKENTKFLNNRGVTFIEKGRDIDAFSAWQKAMQLEKTSDESKPTFGKAIADFTEAIRLSKSEPHNLATIFKNRSIAYIESNEYDKAIADCNEALALDKDKDKDSSVLYTRGIAHDARGDHDQAIADYTRAIELTPLHHEMLLYSGLFYNRGLAQDEKGEYELAIADYTQAICIIEKNDSFPLSVVADAYCNRGLAYKALGQMDKAEADFAKLDRQNHGEIIYRQGRKRGHLTSIG